MKYLEIWNTLKKHLNDAILDAEYSRSLEVLFQSLPVMKHGIIEFREKPYDPQVDLMLCVFKKENEHKTLLDFIENANISSRHNKWEKINEFLLNWLKPKSANGQFLDNIYVVFDNQQHQNGNVEPWLYLAFHPMPFEKETIFQVYKKGGEYYPDKIDTTMWQNLSKSIYATNENAWVFGYGLLKSRGKNKMRIGVCDFKFITEISDYLKRIHWPGDVEHLLKSVAFIEGFADTFVLAVDFNEEVDLRIGIECVLSKKDHKENAIRMIKIIQAHTSYDGKRKEAALNWIGSDEISCAGGEEIKIERWINHIKLRYDGTDDLEIKPYFYYDIQS